VTAEKYLLREKSCTFLLSTERRLASDNFADVIRTLFSDVRALCVGISQRRGCGHERARQIGF
jgi:hypothetical protein